MQYYNPVELQLTVGLTYCIRSKEATRCVITGLQPRDKAAMSDIAALSRGCTIKFFLEEFA